MQVMKRNQAARQVRVHPAVPGHAGPAAAGPVHVRPAAGPAHVRPVATGLADAGPAAGAVRAPFSVAAAIASAASAGAAFTAASAAAPAAVAACRACGQRIPGVPPGASLAYNASAAHAARQGAPAVHAGRSAAQPPGESRAATMPIAPGWDEVHAEGAPRATLAQDAPALVAAHATSAVAAHGARIAVDAATYAPPAARPAPAAPPAPSPAAPTGPAALLRAIALRGSQSALASAIGVSQSHVWHWLARLRVPAEHCPAIERATQRAVRCEELRPDIDWGYLRALCEPARDIAHEPSHGTTHEAAHEIAQDAVPPIRRTLRQASAPDAPNALDAPDAKDAKDTQLHTT